MLKDFAPAAVSGEIASWWAPPVNEQIAIGGPTGGNGGTGATTATAEPTAWPTYRGSVARTGSLDGRDGPAKPDILWTYECKPAQVLASPATLGGFVFTGGTDGLTGGNLYVLRASKPAGDAKQLARRTKVGLPVYSPPAIRDGLVVVGEGLHQHKKTLLRCLSLADGSTKWELAVPSHLESGPAVEGGRVFTGAGDEGVLCVSLTDLARAAGKDELGDDVAAEPKVVWRRRHSDADGKRTMHADTSPAVVGDSVVIGSGRFFEPDVGTEVGDRAVVCLSAADGAPRWRTELPFNPWGSPAVAGTGESALVLVGCSSERFEADKLAVAKGEVVALSLRNGSVKWRLDAPGGVLSSVAVVAAGTPSASSAVFCRGDGSVVCVGLDGSPRWTAKPGAGLMAGPTVAGRYVYAADVKASVHCLTVADGRPVWSLDLAAKLKNPGQVIGSPAAAAGRLFLGTDGGYVVCIGTE
jgi:outer membrane protein assembly factor BamB